MRADLLRLLLLASSACGRSGFGLLTARDATPEPDLIADVGDGAVDPCADDRVMLGTWGAPQLVPELSSPQVDEDPTIAFDELELFLVSNRAGGSRIFRSTRADTSQPWSTPVQVSELTTAEEATIALSDDALTMWFGSFRSGGMGMDDIWTSTRPDRSSPWAVPVPVTELNTVSLERGPTVFNNDLAMIFHSNRPGGMGQNDFYLATRASTSEPWSTPTLLGPPNSGFTEQHPWVSACGLVLVYHTNRSGNVDLYEATRASTSDPFSAGAAITELNRASPTIEKDMRLTRDRRRAYFTSDRAGGTAMDIYTVSR